MNTSDIATRDGLRQQLHQVREAAKTAAGYAWIPCDQTIACPCCGIAWWETDGDVLDDWHENGCEFYAQLVILGIGTGKRVKMDVKAFDTRGHPTDWLKTLVEKRAAAREASPEKLVKP